MLFRDFAAIEDLAGVTAATCRSACAAAGGAGNASAPCVAAMFRDYVGGAPWLAPPWDHAVGHCRLYSRCSAVADESSPYIVYLLAGRPDAANWIAQADLCPM